MDSDLITDWAALSSPWRAAFQEAWKSFQLGNFGIGAALHDAEQNVIAVGRNMVASKSGDQKLAGNYMAHAEMNLFASMPTYDARGHHLVSTLEPCIMCAAAALFLNVDSVSFAAEDEYFVGLNDLWKRHPYTRPRAVPTTRTLAGPLSSLARLLPLSHTLATLPESSMAATARNAHPDLAPLAADRGFIEDLRAMESVEAALMVVAGQLGSG